MFSLSLCLLYIYIHVHFIIDISAYLNISTYWFIYIYIYAPVHGLATLWSPSAWSARPYIHRSREAGLSHQLSERQQSCNGEEAMAMCIWTRVSPVLPPQQGHDYWFPQIIRVHLFFSLRYVVILLVCMLWWVLVCTEPLKGQPFGNY